MFNKDLREHLNLHSSHISSLFSKNDRLENRIRDLEFRLQRLADHSNKAWQGDATYGYWVDICNGACKKKGGK